MHQDVDIVLGDGQGLAAYCLGFLTAQDRAELAPFLRTILTTLDGAEIKGLLRRTTGDRRFSTKDATRFLQDVLSELERP